MTTYKKQEYILTKPLKDIKLYDILKSNRVIIAGGAITSIFNNNKINDYDLYLFNQQYLINVQQYFGENEDEYKLLGTTDSADTYKHLPSDTMIQLIHMENLYNKSASELIKEFDFTICMGAYDIEKEEFILHENFLLNNCEKRLIFNVNTLYPLTSLYRLKKYINKGYNISGGNMIKLGLAINNLHITNYKELKIQLQGIDTSVLKELTDKLLTPEYFEKQYDYEQFLFVIDEYLEKYFDED